MIAKIALALVVGFVSVTSQAAEPAAKKDEPKLSGMDLYNKKGNCIACHGITDPQNKQANTAGNIGPALDYLKGRDPAEITAKIHDATTTNPYTIMPAFGRKGVLTPAEITELVNYLFSVQK